MDENYLNPGAFRQIINLIYEINSKILKIICCILLSNKKRKFLIDKSLMVVDKIIPKIHLRQSLFVYSACGPFTKKGMNAKLKKTQDALDILYQNE